jgi:branched-chain amino acid transport system permease protein
VSAPPAAQTSRAAGAAFIFKKALISALVALVLFSLMIGVRTDAGSDGQLTYWTRFGDLAAMVAAVFGGSIAVELLRQWWGPVETVRVVPAGAEHPRPADAWSRRCCWCSPFWCRSSSTTSATFSTSASLC